MVTIKPKEVRIEKDEEGVQYLILPPIKIEHPEGKESSTGVTIGITHASTGRKIQFNGMDEVGVTVRMDSKPKEKEYVDLSL